jgi:hypothetical protein
MKVLKSNKGAEEPFAARFTKPKVYNHTDKRPQAAQMFARGVIRDVGPIYLRQARSQ